MSLLSYTSNEMYSSTELIRKGKNIFDKLNKNEIEKAIILRDGKPSFILLDFETYENIIKEYISLKDKNPRSQSSQKSKSNENEISDIEFKKALQEIEELELNQNTTKENQPLKDFWE